MLRNLFPFLRAFGLCLSPLAKSISSDRALVMRRNGAIPSWSGILLGEV